jgi:hypothetical protein
MAYLQQRQAGEEMSVRKQQQAHEMGASSGPLESEVRPAAKHGAVGSIVERILRAVAVHDLLH